MTITLEQSNHDSVASFLSKKITEFNHQHWQGTIKQPIAATYRNDHGEILAGASGTTFGNWLHLERLWVSEKHRAKGFGKQLLMMIEDEARTRNCRYVFVDTLEFQAKPFYLKLGYQLQCQQDNYPVSGTRYYLMKQL